MDLTLASIGVLLIPFGLLIALAIKLESDGPVFFVQERLGRRQRPFKCIKFRTMRHGVPGPSWTAQDDLRVTVVGRILRATHLDETPQLVNVLRGEMSIVGPRPLVAIEARIFGATKRPHSRRFAVLPGITGLAQVSVAPDAHAAKFALDAYYVMHRSLWLDGVIILRTFWKLISLRDGYNLPKQCGRRAGTVV